MLEAFDLKPISMAAVPSAIERAQRYRLLNDAEQAESICMDVLEIDPGNQQALAILILAITDQFASGDTSPSTANAYVARLDSEYQRSYFGGIIRERHARALLGRGMARVFAYDAFREAMEWYERAASIRPEGEDEAILRWNACVRTIRRAKLRPSPEEEGELPLE
jgi:hypothetical protein